MICYDGFKHRNKNKGIQNVHIKTDKNRNIHKTIQLKTITNNGYNNNSCLKILCYKYIIIDWNNSSLL